MEGNRWDCDLEELEKTKTLAIDDFLHVSHHLQRYWIEYNESFRVFDLAKTLSSLILVLDERNFNIHLSKILSSRRLLMIADI